jgi:hypothetical protein
MRLRSVAVTVCTALSAIAVTPAAASAHPGLPNDPSLHCYPDDGFVKLCFEQEGDDVWVKDTERDGKSALVRWRVGSRVGECRNAHGAGTWHECTYDFEESVTFLWDQYTYDGDTGLYDLKSGSYSTLT